MGFKRLESDDLVISTDSVTATVWSNNTPSLASFVTSSTQVASNTGQFYYHVYQTASTLTEAAVQFDVAYCDSEGSGSAFYNNLVTGSSPTKTNFGQYRTLVLGDENASFIFGNETGSYFYALSVERARYKEKLLPGVMSLYVSGSGGQIVLTDDSSIKTSTTFTDAGRVYNLVSGSAGTVYTGVNSNGWTSNSGSYGMFLPDIGVLLLSGKALDGAFADGGVVLGTGRAFDTANNNPAKLIQSFVRSGNAGNGMLLNSEETLSSDFIFVRARNSEFNYSENPSFISGSTGAVIFDSFIDNPTTYITTVGMYNDVNELLAVAKLSRPLPKDFTKELLVRVKLDF
jgi:hypothetical protein